jgi:RNA polymerase sigma factor (sigma-70 family)
MLEEKSLVEACIRNNREAQRQFYELYAGKLFALALRYTKNKEDAQDVLQEAFIKIFSKLSSFNFEGSLEGWLKRVVVNTALKSLEKSNNMKFSDLPEYEYDAWNADSNLGLENLSFKSLLNVVNSLPDGCKTIFNLYAIEGYKHQEIAEMLNISLGTSKSQYSRAKELLIEKLKKEKMGVFEES